MRVGGESMFEVDLTGRAVLDDFTEEVGIGIITPFDLVLDREYWRWLPENASLHITRTPTVELPVGIEFVSLISQAAVIMRAVRDLAIASPEVIAYACASGSFVEGLAGEARLRAAMEEAGAKRAVTTSGALLEALQALDAKRVAVGTPYDGEVTERLSRFLAEAGRDTVSNAFLGLTGDIFRVSADSVRALAIAVDRPEADAVFLSCTNLRTFRVLPELEKELGKPVLSANQVTMWAALRAAGLADDWHRPPPSPLWGRSAW
ncbi:MAG: maleate cis-trans isomerase family protein [Rubrobacteraceae bacterium]